MKKAFISVMVMVSILVLAVSCKKDPIGLDPDPKPHQDTSIFIGTWACVFDTSDTPVGWKEQKMEVWQLPVGFRNPDTILFVNDTLKRSQNTGFESNYFYNSDSIYFYNIVDGRSSAIGYGYYLHNDTLIFDPDTSKYVPVFKKVQ